MLDKNRDALISIAAKLLTSGFSEYRDDYSFKIPKYFLREIEQNNKFLRYVSSKIAKVARGKK